jgi:Subtilase family
VTGVCRFLRGTLPVVVAIAVATGFVLPASAAQLARAPRTAAPDLAGQWWLTSLHVPQAWRSATGKGAGVTVAVLSTGVSTSQQDLSGAVLTGPDYAGSGRVPGGPFWGFEGTAVAGLIAGHGHGAGDASGSMGIAPRARILSVPVTLEYDDPLNSDAAITRRLPDAIAAGIRYAVAHGARVIALPLDPGTLGLAAGGDPVAEGGSAAERAAVAYAVAHDVVLVAPAGDNGMGTARVNYPAAYPGVLAVGATAKGGQLASFTNKGSYVALTAPGSGLTVAAPGGYGTLASTDMSAALAAGVAALIRSPFPGLSAAAVVQAMERGVTGRAAPGAGHGALDAAGALAAAATLAARQAPPATAKPSPQPSVTPAPRHAATSSAARSGAGILAGSLLRDAVIVLGVLIAALAGALVLHSTRRRRAAAARQPRAAGAGGGVHARRPMAALPPAPAALRPPLEDSWGRPRPQGIVSPRLAPPPPPGSLGSPSPSPSRARRAKRGETGEPPWEPAKPPGTVQPAAAADELLPPWELTTGLAAAPVSTDLPELPKANTGPMYVWNPSASGPLPILREDEEEKEQLFGTGP